MAPAQASSRFGVSESSKYSKLRERLRADLKEAIAGMKPPKKDKPCPASDQSTDESTEPQ
jgi:hypothetical protein